MNKAQLLLLISISLFGCKSAKFKTLNKDVNTLINSRFYENQFTGVFVYDPATKDTVYSNNSDKYFTPASNTKIFTLYAALKTLPDSIPTLKYIEDKETLYIEGAGDPSFLHPYFKDSTALKFVSNYKRVVLNLSNFQDTHFAPGWAWEDYDTYFSPERSGFPMYGNVVEISNSENLQVSPKFFKEHVVIDRAKTIRRDYGSNTFYYNRVRDTLQIPIAINDTVVVNLWRDITNTQLSLGKSSTTSKKKVLYSIPSDSLYKRMMLESDNFLAEQMLILASSTRSDTLSSETARKYLLNKYLQNMPHQPRWVDGSGLSRYNLFTPESIVYVLDRMYREIPRTRVFNFFPNDAFSEGEDKPRAYIYAKSGTIGNNYCLSGFLITKSGKTLLFSFMNNHYKRPTRDVKRNLQVVLETIRNTY